VNGEGAIKKLRKLSVGSFAFIEELDSLKWEISLDSLEFRNKMCR